MRIEIKYNVIRGEVGELPNGGRKRAQLVGAEIEPERERAMRLAEMIEIQIPDLVRLVSRPIESGREMSWLAKR